LLIVNCGLLIKYMANFPSNSWKPIFESAKERGLFQPIVDNLSREKSLGKIIFPPSKDIFRAFDLCDLANLKVVILGQDPYHGTGEANGLCFSVHEGIRTPPSLKNIFKELHLEFEDYNESRSTDLSDWATQGVLLINSVLTVEKDLPASHGKYGWQAFTDYIIQSISEQSNFVIFILLGNFAKSKIPLIHTDKHTIIEAAHPSPFSAHKGFFGSNIFKICNQKLKEKNRTEINW